MTQDSNRKKKVAAIILAYPVVLILVALVVNSLVLGVKPAVVAMPSTAVITVMVAGAVLLLLNHTWLMTQTELTRLKYNMHATPEEWQASGHSRSDVPQEGLRELERCHNAHRNLTENVAYFVPLAVLFCIVSATPMAASLWIAGFAVGRLGHTFSYLTGRDNARGIFMSISLVSLYGMAGYLIVSLIV